jgi:hypothetical protein
MTDPISTDQIAETLPIDWSDDQITTTDPMSTTDPIIITIYYWKLETQTVQTPTTETAAKLFTPTKNPTMYSASKSNESLFAKRLHALSFNLVHNKCVHYFNQWCMFY